jgi:decaprenyl-phosphate phosphoribosyltransferase
MHSEAEPQASGAPTVEQALGHHVARASRVPPAGALVRACRPRQWVKNVLVLAAPAAAGVLFHGDVAGKLALTFASFCMLASATYLFNDLHDRAEDRRNPRRAHRPIAAGEISTSVALIGALGLGLGGLALAALVRVELAAVGLGYLVLTCSYTLWLRRIAIADIAAVAGGFVLRALAGGVAISVPVSRWFMLVTSFGALFMVAGKRYAELREGAALSPRASLLAYSEQYLRFVLGVTAAVTTTSYCLWAFQRAHSEKLSWYEATIVPFVLWLLRYAMMLDRGDGHSPEELMFSDGFLLTMSAAWVVVFGVGVYVAG